jgi:hypothetical protein
MLSLGLGPSVHCNVSISQWVRAMTSRQDGLAAMLLKGNLKATSRLLQDDIFQDVFENVGLFCGDSHCNVGDAKEECLDPPNQAKSNHQNSSDWKEQGNLKVCKGSAAVLLGCLFWLLLGESHCNLGDTKESTKSSQIESPKQ